MAGGGGVPGVAVGMAGAAALLIYAGYRGVNPLEALREVASGQPAGLEAQTAAHEALWEGVGTESGAGGGGGSGAAQASLSDASGGTHPEFVTAAGDYVGDLYSRPRRWQPGYSDCASFVGKALKKCGVTPPGASVTTSYLSWRQAKVIDKSQIGAGDLLVSVGHMAIAINGTNAIGQQNRTQNVQIGPIKNLMWGQSWVAMRYVGPASRKGAR